MITIYGHPDCQPCRVVSRKLKREGVPYDYVDLAEHPEKRRQLQAQGFQSTPIIDTPTERFVGYQPDRLNAAVAQVRQQQMEQQRQVQQSLDSKHTTSEVN